MKPADIESQSSIQQQKPIKAIRPYELLSVILLSFCVVMDVVFMPVIIYIIVNSAVGFANPLELLFMILLIVTKYSLIALQIYGMFFLKDHEKRKVLTGIMALIMLSIVLMFVSWAILLLIKGATILMILKDPIMYYLLFAVVFSIPGVIEVYLD
jgi:hypothetical protein